MDSKRCVSFFPSDVPSRLRSGNGLEDPVRRHRGPTALRLARLAPRRRTSLHAEGLHPQAPRAARLAQVQRLPLAPHRGPGLAHRDQEISQAHRSGCVPVGFDDRATHARSGAPEVLGQAPRRLLHAGRRARGRAVRGRPRHHCRPPEPDAATRAGRDRGRRLVGWDEILEGGLAPGATVMSWRGEAGGIAAAKAGHDVVMAPQQPTYMDHSQSELATEPQGIGGHNSLEDVYRYEPIPAELNADEAKHVLGSQGQVWTEYMPDPKRVEYMAWPRLAALAEVLWSPKDACDWDGFQQRLAAHLERLAVLDVNYHGRWPKPA